MGNLQDVCPYKVGGGLMNGWGVSTWYTSLPTITLKRVAYALCFVTYLLCWLIRKKKD